ncbi:cytochrome P450 [Aspergillus violaceofuscus CBS 115571]|uniref:Cytochrome P450 n=1 Tax=Aspergillus violaceofuscus (strain CBS 115571) TaxID=1450538 RepID=A0A2V5GVA0_ASPV1|nr:cytochrome P450 [Aspergillus violaceofuscus CBS 115571]
MALSISLTALTPTGIALLFCITILLLLSYYHLTPTVKKSQLPLPPGPKGLPIIGNLHQAPRQKAWEVYKQWSDRYGPIMTVNNGGNITIIVSSHHMVETFLAKHNAVFSSRPQLLVLERALHGFTTPALPYGEKWLTHRALRGAVLKPTMAVKYRGINDLESKQLLHELLTKGDHFTECVRRQAASLFLGTAMLREFFPILKYLPGNDKFLKQLDDVGERLANIYVKRFRDGLRTPTWNWAKEYVSRPEAKGMSELELSFCIGSTYQASLTPYEILRIIVLAAIFHPEEMCRLQREIDAVVIAFVYEALRWHAFSPLGAPRAISSDIEYNGYLLPKGATLVLNQWAMDHDENVYDDPFTFRPQRWIDNPNLPHVIFGFGLRGCPGQHLAREHLFINTARLFWAYDFGHAYENGEKVELDLDELMQPRGGGSAFNQVPSFPASVVIRNETRKKMVEKAWNAVEKDEQKILAEAMPLKA